MLTLAKTFGFLCATALVAGTASSALAYNYPLQYTPVGNYTNLVLAGYQFSAKNVIGNCSYDQVNPGAANAPVNQTCTWDPFGKLISVAAGAPAVPAPVGTSGSQTIYARYPGAPNALYTGFDSASYYGGFIWHWSPHFLWGAPSASNVLNNPTPYTFYVWLYSNGDVPLNINNISLTTEVGKGQINSSTCVGSILPRNFCSLSVTYDPSALTSPDGVIQDTLILKVSSNATDTAPFPATFTVNNVPHGSKTAGR